MNVRNGAATDAVREDEIMTKYNVSFVRENAAGQIETETIGSYKRLGTALNKARAAAGDGAKYAKRGADEHAYSGANGLAVVCG